MMEFWGVEVPSGKPLTCNPGVESYLHVSQAALGESKSGKGNDRVVLKVKVGEIEVVVGTLSQGKCDQTTLDLIFEKEFVLSHNGSCSVFFIGYKTEAVFNESSDDEEEEFEVSEEEDEDLVQHGTKEIGKLGLKAGKPEASSGNSKPAAKSPATKVEVEVKPKGKPAAIADKNKVGSGKSAAADGEDDDEDDDESDDDDEDEMLGSDSFVDSEEEGDDDMEDEDESEDDDLPKFAGKKRPAPPVQNLESGKKSKPATPEGKVEVKAPSVPASTPKQQQQNAKKDLSGKKSAGKDKTNTPGSGKKPGQYVCQPCNKNFNSETALTMHNTAKHK